MRPRHRYGVVLHPVARTERGWTLLVAIRVDGTCWAVVDDGLSKHEDEATFDDPEIAADHALALAGALEAMAYQAHVVSQGVVN